MTRRERLEAKLEKRREWAENRERSANANISRSMDMISGIPMGQPILIGHHSEKGHRALLARSDAAMRRGCEDHAMAEHHEEKADGLERQLETCIFSDDENAVEAIEKKVAALEAKRERMKAINAAHKRYLKKPETLDAAELTEDEKTAIRNYKPAYSWEPHPFPPYSFQNLGGNIRRYKERIKSVKARKARAAEAEAAGGMTIKESGEWATVTFAEKPDRAILNDLKAAGFYWGAGSWSGRSDKLPESVANMAAEVAGKVGE